MRKRTVRAALAACVLATGSAFFVDLATGTASAATTPTTLTDQQRHPISGYHADRMVVDRVHQRLLIADDVAHRILSVRYDGTVAAEVAVPGGVNAGDLQLSADSGTLWATVPAANLIVSWDAATLAEIKAYPVAVYDLGHLALAGDKAWFTYAKNYFASLDPATGEVAKYVLGDGNDTSGGSRQPLIAVSPTDPNRLALTYVSTQSTLFLYDIRGATTTLVTKSNTDMVYGHDSLEYTPDGRMIYRGGVGGVSAVWAPGPSIYPSHTLSMDRPADVEAGPDGWIAVGLPPTTGATELRLFPDLATSSAREFDIPITAGTLELVDLAWGTDVLFAITTDSLGAQNLWRIDQPTVVPTPPTTPPSAQSATAIKLSGPVSGVPDGGVSILGSLSGGLPVGTPLKVVRNDTGTELPTVWTNGSGEFSFLDFPSVEGRATYTVTFAGHATHQPSSATISVPITRVAAALSLNRNGSVNAYGATVAITAHLGGTPKPRIVEIWADPSGADQPRRLIKKGAVSGSGNLSVNYKLTRNTTFSAVYGGDSLYAPRTVNATLKTNVAVTTTVARHYTIKSSTYLVRKTKNPTFATTMTPLAGRKARLIFERYSGGRWVAWKAGTFKLTSAGRYTYTLTGAHATGVKYRMRSAYLPGTSGDSLNNTTYGPWKYFTFTR